MKGISLKTIFIILIIILLGIAVYNSFFKKDKASTVVSKFQESVSNKIISTDIRIGIMEFDNMNGFGDVERLSD